MFSNSAEVANISILNNVCNAVFTYAPRSVLFYDYACMHACYAMQVFYQSVPYQAAWWMAEPWGYPNASQPYAPCRRPNACGWGHSIHEDSNVFYQAKTVTAPLIILGGDAEAPFCTGAMCKQLDHAVYFAANFSSYVNHTGNGVHSLVCDPLLVGLPAMDVDGSRGLRPSNMTDVAPTKHSPM
jgi:hypothetical protein